MFLHTSTKWRIAQEHAEGHKGGDEGEGDEEAETGALRTSHAHCSDLDSHAESHNFLAAGGEISPSHCLASCS